MAKVYSVSGEAKAETKLPRIFSATYRPDLIKNAVLSIQASKRQAYGADKLAGKRTSAHYHGRRRKRNTMMGRGISRMARIHGKVGHLSFRARFVPQAVKGREAHPPKAEKSWEKPMNRKEMSLALRSSLAAGSDKEIVKSRGHLFENDVPVIVEAAFENIAKAKDMRLLFEKIGLGKEMERCKEKKTKAGKGKMRGRKTRTRKGVLVIVSKECSAMKAANNLPGVDVTTSSDVDVEMLAPGTKPGRLMLISEPALESIEKRFS